jgi:hypothetical protein
VLDVRRAFSPETASRRTEEGPSVEAGDRPLTYSSHLGFGNFGSHEFVEH